MAWMGTRDIYAALGLTAVFTILSDFLFNEESSLCIVPNKYRVLEKLLDTNNDGIVTEEELNQATKILEKAKKEKQKKEQRTAFNNFNYLYIFFPNVSSRRKNFYLKQVSLKSNFYDLPWSQGTFDSHV